MSPRPYLADCGKCTLLWDASNGQFDMEEHPDCPTHGWSDNAMEGEVIDVWPFRRDRVIWPPVTKSDSPPGEKPPPSPET